MDLLTTFVTWYYNQFRFDPLYDQMWNTVEESPHHRESNVGVHTDMVVGQYLSRTKTWDHYAILGALAATFHDVGKPDARERKWKEERGWYNKFAGHELVSARLWEDYAVRNWKYLSTLFNLTPRDLYTIGWMIEHHLPYDITKEYKFNGLVKTMLDVDITRGPEVFTTLLQSDVWGRISDDMYTPDGKVHRVDEWVAKFMDQTDKLFHTWFETPGHPTVYILIGPSGAGKSTAVKNITAPNSYYFSLDQLRLDWYSDDYAEAFEMSCDDKHFASNTNKAYTDILRATKHDRDVIVDNTNGSAKRRRFYVQEARNRGFNVHMIIMPAALEQLYSRQKTRKDKSVPQGAVRGQYMKMNYPSFDEADQVTVLDHNLKEYLNG